MTRTQKAIQRVQPKLKPFKAFEEILDESGESRPCWVVIPKTMSNTLELTITIESVKLPKGTGNEPSKIAKMLKVPIDWILDVAIFREKEGFVGIIKPANRRLNFSTLFRELNCSWAAFPSQEDLHQFGTINLKNPFALASRRSVRIVIDAWILQQQPKTLVIPLGDDRALSTCVTDLMIGTSAKVLGGITISN